MSKVQLFYNQLVLLQFDVYVLELVQFLYDVLDAQMAVPARKISSRPVTKP